jgi:hypothetical protein
VDTESASRYILFDGGDKQRLRAGITRVRREPLTEPLDDDWKVRDA